MRAFLIFFAILITFTACNQELEKPKDLISKEQMISILKDVYIFRQFQNYRISDDLPDVPHANLEILHQHNVSLEQFQTSYKYYVIDNAAYDQLLDEVIKELESELPDEMLVEPENFSMPPSAN